MTNAQKSEPIAFGLSPFEGDRPQWQFGSRLPDLGVTINASGESRGGLNQGHQRWATGVMGVAKTARSCLALDELKSLDDPGVERLFALRFGLSVGLIKH